MNMDNIKLNKEVDDILKDIFDLTNQQTNPSVNEIRQLIIKIKNKYIKVATYESLSAIENNTTTTNINNISDDVLYNKLQVYKILLIDILKEKCSEEEFKRLINEYKLEV